MKLKDKIKNWLCAEEIDRINRLEKEIHNATDKMRLSSVLLDEAEKEVKACRKLITEICDVGVDVGFHDDHSWAVVCVAGKPEYVKFIPLNSGDTREVIKFLKQFEYSKRIVDSPLAFRSILDDRIVKR